MPGPSGELTITDKWTCGQQNRKSITNGHVTMLFLEPEFQNSLHKDNKQKKYENYQQNLAVFSAATDSDKKIILI